MFPRPTGLVRSTLLGLATLVALATQAPAQSPAPAQSLRKFSTDYVAPMVVTSLDADRLLIADQAGVAYVTDRNGTRLEQPFLDLRPKLSKLNKGFDERGLLGLALHPKFTENRKLYAYYSAPLRTGVSTNWDHTSHVSEFIASPDLARADLASERVLLRVDQPYFNHNGGRLAFGPDGRLYIALGDGGNAHDVGHDRGPGGNAQNLATLLGKILRLDIDRAEAPNAYAIPSDNPFVGKPGARPEIYAWGIRNPWGMSFDKGGQRQLFAADVGQGRYEEINIIEKGANYGWNRLEGRFAFDPKKSMQIDVAETLSPAERASFRDPIVMYKNLNAWPKDPGAAGISVTGGFVYRGKALPHLVGRYIFGDWSTKFASPDGHLFSAAPRTDGKSDGSWKMERLPLASHPDGALGAYVVAFGEDAEGELYVLTNEKAGLLDRTGVVWKLVPAK